MWTWPFPFPPRNPSRQNFQQSQPKYAIKRSHIYYEQSSRCVCHYIYLLCHYLRLDTVPKPTVQGQTGRESHTGCLEAIGGILTLLCCPISCILCCLWEVIGGILCWLWNATGEVILEALGVLTVAFFWTIPIFERVNDIIGGDRTQDVTEGRMRVGTFYASPPSQRVPGS